jgi:SAM-dependent methyltransferase
MVPDHAMNAALKGVESRLFFDAIARRYDRVYGLDREASRRGMARLLTALPKAPARVLDLGVGTGRELGALQDAGYSAVGLDISPRMLEQCARRARPVELIEADLWASLPLGDSTFDAVIALHGTLSHPPNDAAPLRLAREIARVLVKGGVFVFEVPSPSWLESLDVRDAHDARGMDTTIARVDARTCVHRDSVADVAIDVVVRSKDEWTALLGPNLVAKCETVDAFEIFVVARKP